jgi:hypothetical protein
LHIHWKQYRPRGGFGNRGLTRINQRNNEDLTLEGLMAIVAGAFAVEPYCTVFGSTHDEDLSRETHPPVCGILTAFRFS